ncbi:hypothetical protein MtrunA17_Chr3g0139551 [Medicago truncatula]|uniref:Uncharacterized protein n=1 Tax=Medicago truncatula TaxID=3880 RepID=A0A396J1Q8_MEDTR|nr:hypothetical protein MtrunA17_Chr3g0139551 [Medicago truncatula]
MRNHAIILRFTCSRYEDVDVEGHMIGRIRISRCEIEHLFDDVTSRVLL